MSMNNVNGKISEAAIHGLAGGLMGQVKELRMEGKKSDSFFHSKKMSQIIKLRCRIQCLYLCLMKLLRRQIHLLLRGNHTRQNIN